MAELIKETVTSQGSNQSPAVSTQTHETARTVTVSSSQTIEYLVYFFFGTLDVFLAFRLILKLTGANVGSAFVGLIYGLTGIFVMPFEGIFNKGYAPGLVQTSVLEPATIVAILVYGLLAWGIVSLLRIVSGKKQSEITT